MRPYWWLFKGFEIREDRSGRDKVFIRDFPDDLEAIARSNPTPMYLINADRVVEKIQLVRKAFCSQYPGSAEIHFAMKECHIPQVLQLIFDQGCGIDAASPNEVRLGLRLGVPPEKIIHTSPSLSEQNLQELLNTGVRINIDSFAQARTLVRIRQKNDAPAPKLSIRLNPGVGAGGDPYSVTGGVRSPQGVPVKFGVTEEVALKIVDYLHGNALSVDTLHFHIGSGWLDPEYAFRRALRKLSQFYGRLSERFGTVQRIDVGGGPGVRGRADQECFSWKKYISVICECFRETGIKPEVLMLEPGDSLVLDAGVLLAKVNAVEEKNGVEHVYVDAGMGSFPAVRLYGEWHEIVNVSHPYGRLKEYSVDGNCCETGDSFTLDHLRRLEEVREGDVLAFLDATGFAEQSFNYCLWGRAHIALRRGDRLIPCTAGVESLDRILSRFETSAGT
ncbi:MAG: hypothetical protein JSV89_16820 [Spirochaetaceae bacterium]|nr:MAG: hypothetical protein JSV89_16820 [Spirochaetaceae bacterium]